MSCQLCASHKDDTTRSQAEAEAAAAAIGIVPKSLAHQLPRLKRETFSVLATILSIKSTFAAFVVA